MWRRLCMGMIMRKRIVQFHDEKYVLLDGDRCGYLKVKLAAFSGGYPLQIIFCYLLRDCTNIITFSLLFFL